MKSIKYNKVLDEIANVKKDILVLQREKKELKKELKELEAAAFDWSDVRFATWVFTKDKRTSGRFVHFENNTIFWKSMFDGLKASIPEDMEIQDPNEFHDIDYVDGIKF